MSPNSKTVRKKICMEFFPNCGICSCFPECFPDNGLKDEFSELALLEQIMENNNMSGLKRKK